MSNSFSPLIPLPPALPAKRGEQGELRRLVAGGFAAGHQPLLYLPHPVGAKDFSPQRGEGKGVGHHLLKMSNVFAILSLLAFCVALVFFLAARQQRVRAGLPYGARIIYADTGAWQQVERPLISRRYGLVGKPDYIVEEGGALIPVEVKPSRVARIPYESDILQLAAYVVLVEEHFGVASGYGLLKYRDVVFRVPLTDALRARLLEVLAALRHDWVARDLPRSHSDPPRCRQCGYRAQCGQALT